MRVKPPQLPPRPRSRASTPAAAVWQRPRPWPVDQAQSRASCTQAGGRATSTLRSRLGIQGLRCARCASPRSRGQRARCACRRHSPARWYTAGCTPRAARAHGRAVVARTLARIAAVSHLVRTSVPAVVRARAGSPGTRTCAPRPAHRRPPPGACHQSGATKPKSPRSVPIVARQPRSFSGAPAGRRRPDALPLRLPRALAPQRDSTAQPATKQ